MAKRLSRETDRAAGVLTSMACGFVSKSIRREKMPGMYRFARQRTTVQGPRRGRLACRMQPMEIWVSVSMRVR